MDNAYILQLHTGSFLKAHTTIEEVKEKLSDLLNTKPIKAIIFGWCVDKTLNEKLLTYFHTFSLPCYIWLPVFSEIDTMIDGEAIVNVHGKQGGNVSVIEDESFSFLCPNQEKNKLGFLSIYECYFSDLPFDGVFLDKIRYPSFANGYEEGFGCFCEVCREKFRKEGVDISYIEEAIGKHSSDFLKGNYDAYGHFIFDNEKINHFYQVRSSWISNSIQELISYFHVRNLKVGLDIFSPFFAYYCGQDIKALSQTADFLKPMFYRYTNAPAGMQYEQEKFLQYFPKQSKPSPITISALQEQCQHLKAADCKSYPGIEINPIEDICFVDKERLRENLSFFQSEFPTIVCCWNCLLMEPSFQSLL